MALVLWKPAIIPFLVLAACVACGGGSGPVVGAPNQNAAAAVGAAVAAGAAAGQPIPQACPSALPPGAITLFQPVSGSTVNASTNAVVFIETPLSAPKNGWGSLTLNGTGQGALAAAAIPSPLPTGEIFLSAPITQPLTSGMTYQVAVTYTDGCGYPDAIALGTFSTQ
ncbi:MAG TPA: hypothetical protein VGP41_02715 [Candidatus Lustribacter sp.]|jgi:hypothetical protein|nr:hypothetical protein [Candidatus Lustribacter sp.]